MIHALTRSYGLGAPRGVGDVVDDMEYKLGAWLDQKVQDETNVAYDTLRARFEQDKDQIADDVVAAMTPKVKVAVAQLLSDADTQAQLGATRDAIQQDFQKSLIKVIGVGAIGTALLTYFLVRYAGGARR